MIPNRKSNNTRKSKIGAYLFLRQLRREPYKGVFSALSHVATILTLPVVLIFSLLTWLEAKQARQDQLQYFQLEKSPNVQPTLFTFKAIAGTDEKVIYLTWKNQGESTAFKFRAEITYSGGRKMFSSDDNRNWGILDKGNKYTLRKNTETTYLIATTGTIERQTTNIIKNVRASMTNDFGAEGEFYLGELRYFYQDNFGVQYSGTSALWAKRAE